MLTRLTIAGIVFFWLLMNGALVRLWMHPETSEILTLPVEHVVKQVFLHSQASNLVIYQNGRRAGGLALQPRRVDPEGLRVVDFVGNLLLELPLLNQQALNWRGSVEMNRAFRVRHVKLHIDTRSPRISADISVDRKHKVATYTVTQDDGEPVETKLSLDEKGARSALEGLGIDPNVATQLASSTESMGSSSAGLAVTARQSQIQMRGERIDVFHLTFRQNTSPLMEIDISQLGQLLGVKTAFGFTFSPDD